MQACGAPDLLQKGVNGLPHKPGVFWSFGGSGFPESREWALSSRLNSGFSFLKISISFSSCFAFCIHQGHQPELQTTMSQCIEISGLSVAQELFDFIENEACVAWF